MATPITPACPSIPHFPVRELGLQGCRRTCKALVGEKEQEGVSTVEGALPAATAAELLANGDLRGAGIGKI